MSDKNRVETIDLTMEDADVSCALLPENKDKKFIVSGSYLRRLLQKSQEF